MRTPFPQAAPGGEHAGRGATATWSGSVARRSLVAAAVIAVAGLLAPLTANAAGTLDQQQTSTSGGAIILGATNTLAQTFTAGISGKLDQVELYLGEQGATSSLTVEIRNTVAGEPGSIVLATTTIPAASVPYFNPFGFRGEFVAASFTGPAQVTAGTQYAIVSHLTEPGPSEYFLSLGANNPYLSGAEWRSTNPPTVWHEEESDLAFKTYVEPQQIPTSKEQCKDGGWKNYGTMFKNQGQCVSFVEG